jgi:hypothetical protein
MRSYFIDLELLIDKWLLLLQFWVKCKHDAHQSTALSMLYNFGFECKVNRLTVRPQTHEMSVRESAPSRGDRVFHELLRPNAWSGDIGLKRLLIEHSKSYRMMCRIITFDEY